MPRIAQLHDNLDRTRYFRLERENVIGRSTECNMVFEDKHVSRRHARICASPGGKAYWVEDISARGTFVNFKRIKGRFPLSEGDRICVIQFRNIHPTELERMTEQDLKECCDDPRNESVRPVVDLTFGYVEVEEEKPQVEARPEGFFARLKGLFGRK